MTDRWLCIVLFYYRSNGSGMRGLVMVRTRRLSPMMLLPPSHSLLLASIARHRTIANALAPTPVCRIWMLLPELP
jgi:hypothetical protein